MNIWPAVAFLLSGCTASTGIVLSDMGSFHVGGREVTLTGKPVQEVVFSPGGVPARIDPNGLYQVEQMYVQYFIPANLRGRVPLMLWHGGGLTGVSFESTPDGREGWLNYFLKEGWSVYNSDAVERGRSGWAQFPDVFAGEPLFLTKNNPFERFRIGAGPGSYDRDPARMRLLPGSQFPKEGYDNFTRQIVPRWTTTDEATIAAYVALVDRVGPAVLVAHSQGGPFALRVAQLRPDKIQALVLVEPAGGGDLPLATKLRSIPILAVYGDYIDEDSRWPQIRASGLRYLDAVREAGGSYEVIDLPKLGIRGNSHMMMMDRNNRVVAAVIQRWLTDRGLYR